MDASMSKLPTRIAWRATIPPREITAVSVVPPPTSTIMLPRGSWIGRPAPMAAAMGCSIKYAPLAPAPRAASSTARRSTSVIAEGTQISTRGRLKRDTPARCRSSRIMRWVMSKSVMAPLRRGRTATMYPGVRPIICHASWPIARTSWVRELRAMTVGSLRTMPRPRVYTRVLAVPRSIARSLATLTPDGSVAEVAEPLGEAGHVLFPFLLPEPLCLRWTSGYWILARICREGNLRVHLRPLAAGLASAAILTGETLGRLGRRSRSSPAPGFVGPLGGQGLQLPAERLDAGLEGLGLAVAQDVPRADHGGDEDGHDHIQQVLEVHRTEHQGAARPSTSATSWAPVPQSTPPSHVSRFQIGTVDLRVSMHQRAATNASWR